MQKKENKLINGMNALKQTGNKSVGILSFL